MYQRHNIPQKQLYTAALKQPLSLCKGYQKLQLSQAGQAHSLSCNGERRTWGERSMQKSPLCQEPYEHRGRCGHFPKQLLTRCAWEEWRGLEVWIMFWGTFRTCAVRKIWHCGMGCEPDPQAHFSVLTTRE